MSRRTRTLGTIPPEDRDGAWLRRREAEAAAALDRSQRVVERQDRAGVAAIVDGISRGELESTEIADFLRLVEIGNDAQNAEFLARRVQGKMLFNSTEKCWYVFDGRRWARDNVARPICEAKAAAYEMLRLSLAVSHDGMRQKAAKYATACSSRRKLEAMLELAKAELPALPEQFDRDPYALNVANGTLDLRTGILRAHDANDLLTKMAPVDYIEDAQAPRWERFLSEVFLGRQDLVDYVQRLLGYALTGDVSEHVLPIAYGLGANGKSVLMRVILALLGDYALQADVALFLARREHGATPELARLKAVRFVAASEMPEGGRLSENLVKSLTGGDRIAARHLYGEFFEFQPTAKYLIATNYKPVVRGDDDGIWRRLKLLPFDARFEGANRDSRLVEKLETELSGILRWAVDGCKLWIRDGLQDPRPVVAAMATYRSESDAIASFLADRCVIAEGCEVRASALGSEYKSWCETSNERPATARILRAKIRQRGFADRRTNGDVVFSGLGLREQC